MDCRSSDAVVSSRTPQMWSYLTVEAALQKSRIVCDCIPLRSALN